MNDEEDFCEDNDKEACCGNHSESCEDALTNLMTENARLKDEIRRLIEFIRVIDINPDGVDHGVSVGFARETIAHLVPTGSEFYGEEETS